MTTKIFGQWSFAQKIFNGAIDSYMYVNIKSENTKHIAPLAWKVVIFSFLPSEALLVCLPKLSGPLFITLTLVHAKLHLKWESTSSGEVFLCLSMCLLCLNVFRILSSLLVKEIGQHGFLNFFPLCFNCVFAVWEYMHMGVGELRCQKRAPVWLLETKLKFCARAASALNQWAISSALKRAFVAGIFCTILIQGLTLLTFSD